MHGLIECVQQEVESKSIVVNGVESGRGKLGTDGTRSGFWSMMNRNGARQKGKTYPSGESVIFRIENRDAILACARFVRKRDNLHGELLKRGRWVPSKS